MQLTECMNEDDFIGHAPIVEFSSEIQHEIYDRVGSAIVGVLARDEGRSARMPFGFIVELQDGRTVGYPVIYLPAEVPISLK